MPTLIAINGFGRIGRLVFRILSKMPEFSIVAINDVVPADNLAYLLKFDTVHGRFAGDVHIEGDYIVANGKKTLVLNERDPTKLPWNKLNVVYVIESTGLFTSKEDAAKHLEAGAKKVIIS